MKKNRFILTLVLLLVLLLPMVPTGNRTYNVTVQIEGFGNAEPLTSDRIGDGGLSHVTFSMFRIDNIGDWTYAMLNPPVSRLTNKTTFVPPQHFAAHAADFTFVANFKAGSFSRSFDSPHLLFTNIDQYDMNVTIAAMDIPAGNYSVDVSLLVNGSSVYVLGGNFTLALP